MLNGGGVRRCLLSFGETRGRGFRCERVGSRMSVSPSPRHHKKEGLISFPFTLSFAHVAFASGISCVVVESYDIRAYFICSSFYG